MMTEDLCPGPKKIIVLIFLLFGSQANAETTKFSWDPVTGATHYLLTVYHDDKDYFIRTTETSIFLDEHTRFSLLALDAQGRILHRPDVKKYFPPSVYRKMLQEWKAKLKGPTTPPPQYEPAPRLTADQQKERDLIASLEKENRKAFSDHWTREVSVFLGAGFESLNSSGGTSTFKGSTMVGSTDLDLSLSPGITSERKAAPWQVNAHFHTHTFSTKHEESVASGQTLQEKTLEYQQYLLGGRYEHNILESAAGVIWATAGLSLKQKPAMKINSEETGSGALKDLAFLGPDIGVLWTKSQGKNLRHKLRLSLGPWASGLKSASFFSLSYTIQYTVQENLFITGSTGYNRDHYTLSLSCPDNLTTPCQETSENKSILTTLKAGLGLWF